MSDQYNESRNQLRYNRISVGLCRDCGGKEPIKDKVVCLECFNKRKNISVNSVKNRIAAGVCTGCGKANVRKGKHHCYDCSQASIERMRNKRKEIKLFIINYFGNKCKECGETDIRCLSLDHVNNDGHLDKKSEKGNRQVTPTWYAKLYKMINSNQQLPRELQLLCFNCHAKKDLKPWWFDDNA